MTHTNVITWRRTFDDAPHDFVAERDGLTLGRIYRHRPGGLEREVWFWTASGLLTTAAEIGKVYGEAQTREEAIGALLDAVERARAWGERTGKPYVRPNPPAWLRS